MTPLIFTGLIALVLFIAIQVAILRWIFRVNHAIKLLESIDTTLKAAPWMRSQPGARPAMPLKRGAA